MDSSSICTLMAIILLPALADLKGESGSELALLWLLLLALLLALALLGAAGGGAADAEEDAGDITFGASVNI